MEETIIKSFIDANLHVALAILVGAAGAFRVGQWIWQKYAEWSEKRDNAWFARLEEVTTQRTLSNGAWRSELSECSRAWREEIRIERELWREEIRIEREARNKEGEKWRALVMQESAARVAQNQHMLQIMAEMLKAVGEHDVRTGAKMDTMFDIWTRFLRKQMGTDFLTGECGIDLD